MFKNESFIPLDKKVLLNNEHHHFNPKRVMAGFL